MIKEGQIYNHSKLSCPVQVKRYKEGSKIATFFYLNTDLSIQKTNFYFSTHDKIGIGNIKNLLPYNNKKQLKLF